MPPKMSRYRRQVAVTRLSFGPKKLKGIKVNFVHPMFEHYTLKIRNVYKREQSTHAELLERNKHNLYNMLQCL